jgi:hypothetical protein
MENQLMVDLKGDYLWVVPERVEIEWALSSSGFY